MIRLKSDIYWVMSQLELYDSLMGIASISCFFLAQQCLVSSIFYVVIRIRKFYTLFTQRRNALAKLRWFVKRLCYVIAFLLASLLFEHCGETFFLSTRDFRDLPYPRQSWWKWVFQQFTDPKLIPNIPPPDPKKASDFFNLKIPLLKLFRLGLKVHWVLLVILCVLNYFTGPLPPNEAGPGGGDDGTEGFRPLRSISGGRSSVDASDVNGLGSSRSTAPDGTSGTEPAEGGGGVSAGSNDMNQANGSGSRAQDSKSNIEPAEGGRATGRSVSGDGASVGVLVHINQLGGSGSRPCTAEIEPAEPANGSGGTDSSSDGCIAVIEPPSDGGNGTERFLAKVWVVTWWLLFAFATFFCWVVVTEMFQPVEEHLAHLWTLQRNNG
jgi:hypothetical protein